MNESRIGLEKWYDFLRSRGKTTRTFGLIDIMAWEKFCRK